MNGKTSKTTIGAFVLGALALAVAGVVLMGSGKLFKTTRHYVLYFQGSVSGLTVGSPVVFRGVRIGAVSQITLQADPKTLQMTIPVVVEVDTDRFRIVPSKDGAPAPAGTPELGKDQHGVLARLIEMGLRAQLQLQSMVTGQLMINLDFMPEAPVRLLGDDSMPEVPTVPSPFDELTKTIEKLPLQEMMDRLVGAISGIERMVNSPETGQLTANLNQTVAEARNLIDDVRTELKPLAARMDQTMARYGDLAATLDGQVEPLAKDMDQALRTYAELAQTLNTKVEAIAAGVARSLDTLDATLKQAERSVTGAGDALGEDSAVMVDLRKTLNELSGAARSIRTWAEYLERHPEALIQGKGDYRR
jgi:paraquat-inducible protein B